MESRTTGPKQNEVDLSELGEYDPRVESIYKAALDQLKYRDAYLQIPKQEITSVIANGLQEIDVFERIAEHISRLELPQNILKKIGLIWVLSGPGTWSEEKKDDRYQNFSWAENWDHMRLSYAGGWVRKITEARMNERFPSGSINAAFDRKRYINEQIERYGPMILYNGTPVENAAAKRALATHTLIMPETKVEIQSGRFKKIENTVDQVREFRLPEGFVLGRDEEIGIVTHAPHMMRLLHMINKYQPFPPETKIRPLPLSTPKEGKEEYAQMEILGLLFYVFLSNNEGATEDNHDASIKAYPNPYLPKH